MMLRKIREEWSNNGDEGGGKMDGMGCLRPSGSRPARLAKRKGGEHQVKESNAVSRW